MNGDSLEILVNLMIPQVEKRLSPNSQSASHYHPLNGHVCLMGHIKSTQKKDYSKFQWHPTVNVNGSRAELAVKEIDQQQLTDLTAGRVSDVSGALRVWICTKKYFPIVQEVTFILVGNGAPIFDATWMAPWPGQ